MTNEKALETLQRTQSLYIRALIESGYPDDQITIISEPQKIAIEALSKQIPKKGIYGFDYACPSCDWQGEYAYSYCPKCGQALIWCKP